MKVYLYLHNHHYHSNSGHSDVCFGNSSQEIAFENGRICNFPGLVTLTLDRATLHNADLYLHAKFH